MSAKAKTANLAPECIDFDQLLPLIGEFGRYQKLLLFLALPFCFFLAFVYLSQIFMTLVPDDHWCRIPELSSLPHQQQLELGIPRSKQGNYENCAMYDVNYTEILLTKQKPNNSWPQTECKQGWVYSDDEIPYQTIATEYNWVCKDDELPGLSVTIYFMGSIIGGLCLGYLSDCWGRLPTLMVSNMCGLVGGLLSAFCYNFLQFALTRFVVGVAFDNCFTLLYILVLEYVGPNYRSMIANFAFALFFTPAACLLPWLAYLCKDWRIFAMATSVPIALVLLFYIILPESARWLISVGRIDEAIETINKVAIRNGNHIPENVLATFRSCCELQLAAEKVRRNYTILDMFKTRHLRRATIILVIIWMTISLLYDVYVRAILRIRLNVFIIFSLANATELPAGIILMLLLNRVGRRHITFFVFVMCAICSFAASVLVNKWHVAVAAIMGRFCANLTYNVGLQWATEILPTVVRGQGVAFIHIMGYVAALVSPLVIYTEHYMDTLPLKILTILSVLGAVLSLLLPETLKAALPQTIEEAELFIASSTC